MKYSPSQYVFKNECSLSTVNPSKHSMSDDSSHIALYEIKIIIMKHNIVVDYILHSYYVFTSTNLFPEQLSSVFGSDIVTWIKLLS